jgi:hypothetical protein
MKQKQKRILLIGLALIIAVAGGFLFLKKFHHALFGTKTAEESRFVNQDNRANKAPHALFFNFEADPKTPEDKGLYKGIAHSGQFSAKAFGKNTYSVSFERKAGDIGIEYMKAVALSAWVYIFPGKNDIESSLVFAASNNGVNLTWQGITLHGNDMPRGKWFKISGFFNLSDIVFSNDTKLQFYFWNNSANDILVDDFYVVFSGPAERRGDSTLVDMTRGTSFTAKFNIPPFPFHYFSKAEIGNRNSEYLVNNDNHPCGEILPEDRIFTGHFLSPLTSTDEILLMKKDGKAEWYSFNKETVQFQQIAALVPSASQKALLSKTVLKGNFTGKNADELLCIDGNLSSILSFRRETNQKPGNGVITPRVKEITISLTGLPETKGITFLSADLDGDRISELLAILPDGSWRSFSFKQNPAHLVVAESGKSGAIREWNSGNTEFKVTPGRFLRKYPQEILLTVFREKGSRSDGYLFYRLDPLLHTFVSCYPEKQNRRGKIIGRDTLKPGDEFIYGRFDEAGNPCVFRYHRDWRYDLKELQFNDTTYQIVANMDFTGFENDHNPKYFSSLRIVPGDFLTPGQTSFLLIQRNPGQMDLKELPDAIQVYTFMNSEKKVVK